MPISLPALTDSERPDGPPLVLLFADLDHAIPLALARASGIPLKTGDIVRRGPRSHYVTSTPARAGDAPITIFDAARFWDSYCDRFFLPAFVPTFLWACPRASVCLLWLAEDRSRQRTLLRVAHHFGLGQIIGIAPDAHKAADIRALVAEVRPDNNDAPVLVLDPGKTKSAVETHRRFLDEIAAHLRRPSVPPLEVFVPPHERPIVGFGLKAGTYALPVPRSGIEPSDHLEALTVRGNIAITISTLDPKAGAIFAAAGVTAPELRALARPGKAKAVTEAKLRGSIPDGRGRVFAFEGSIGTCTVKAGTLVPEPDPLTRRTDAIVVSPGAPVMIGYDDSEVAIARFA
jgi:hypothetical protein